ncbi:Putrescine-binding periplasmic protein precursor [Kingella potus]|uniref:Putrescine-binding periplasmic protein n=1 Tax=Kingella potus TaxID=265175 RepID=A0A377R773_9NEIS|nr:polyamine ABC transporter substrate-binding protein [Kingella potus]STR03405.1 Putrescine-binding periplasmic protein precursor [Kingella potus]
MKKTILTSVLLCLLAACGTQDRSDSAGAADAQPARPSATSELNIFNWSDYVDPDTVAAFEAAEKIKVRYDFYDSNEALEAKLLTGNSGYDLAAPSLSNAGRQIKAGAYLKIDKSLIPNYNGIDPSLLEKMAAVDPGNQYAVPYFWGINTLAVNTAKVRAALDSDELPENEWDLVFKPEYTAKLKSCGISYFDSPTEQYPLALNYLGLDPNSEKPADIEAANALMAKVRPDIKRFTSSGYIDDMAAGNLCVAVGYGGDLNIAKNRAKEAGNGTDILVLAPKSGVGLWIDSFMIPAGAANVLNAHKYISYALQPEIAAKNGSFVRYAPSVSAARDLMDPALAAEPSVFPGPEVLEKSFIVLPKSRETVKLQTRLWQRLKAGSGA